MVEIDYSGIEPEAATTQPSAWRPPRKVFFGKRDPATGIIEDEPVYTHQKFPQMLYLLKDDRLIANIAKNEQEAAALIGSGYRDSPAKWGVTTCPSFDQIQAQNGTPADEPVFAKAKK